MGIDDYTLIDGTYASWAELNMVCQVPSVPDFNTKDFNALSFGVERTPKKVRGAGRRIRGRTAGGVNAKDGSVTFLQDAYYQFLANLKLAAAAQGIQNPDDWDLVSWTIAVDWTPLVGVQLVNTVRLIGVRVLGDEEDHKQGDDENAVTVPLSIVMVERRNAQGEIIR
jgi:hypothetical protein